MEEKAVIVSVFALSIVDFGSKFGLGEIFGDFY